MHRTRYHTPVMHPVAHARDKAAPARRGLSRHPKALLVHARSGRPDCPDRVAFAPVSGHAHPGGGTLGRLARRGGGGPAGGGAARPARTRGRGGGGAACARGNAGGTGRAPSRMCGRCTGATAPPGERARGLWHTGRCAAGGLLTGGLAGAAMRRRPWSGSDRQAGGRVAPRVTARCPLSTPVRRPGQHGRPRRADPPQRVPADATAGSHANRGRAPGAPDSQRRSAVARGPFAALGDRKSIT
jgi:hypothetical protein